MNILIAIIREIVDKTKTAFINGDIETSYVIAPLEEITDDLCDEYKLNH